MERFLTTAKRERPEEPLAVKLSVKDQTPDARKKVARDTKPGGECTAAGRSPHGKAANAAAAHAPITRELLMPHGSEQKVREEEEDTQSEASTTSWHDDRSAVDEEQQQDDPNDDHCAWCQDGGELVCCDGCTNAYHLPCLEDNFPQCTPGDDDDALWSCPRCTGTAPAAQPASSEASTVDWQQQPHTPPQVDGVVRLPHRKRQSAAAKEEPVVVSEYELDRQRNIERNLQRLQALGVHTSLQAMTEPLTKSGGNAKPEKTSREKKPKPDPVLRTMPTRRTRRAAGDEPADKENDPQQAPAKELEDPVALMTLSEYYEKNGIVPGPLMDGHFKGWVKEETCVRLGMARNAADAWEANGGGSFSRKLPPGVSAKDAAPSSVIFLSPSFRTRGAGKSEADARPEETCDWTARYDHPQENARRQMLKNPNGYFYRHCEPGEAQAAGGWTEAEVDLFVRVAERWGAGDKWGLFSSHIPKRVGYQCSAVYRQVIIPAGLLVDNNFMITASGEAIWAPNGKRPGS